MNKVNIINFINNLEPISVLVGAVVIFIFALLIHFFGFNGKRKKKTGLPQLKALVIETHELLMKANHNLQELYKIFKDIERGLK